MRWFIGHDSAQPEGTAVCLTSLERLLPEDVQIDVLDTAQLVKQKYYWRERHPFQSTDFSFSRFLVPFLCGFKGVAVFCDSDFLWRKDPLQLGMYYDETQGVQVVKHNLKADDLHGDTKMGGDKKQLWYPKKNWSSLMMFNCEHPDAKRLSPLAVSQQTPAWLHEFAWSSTIDHSETLPSSFNYLAGYNYPDIDPYAVHFTDGTPTNNGGKEVEYSAEWLNLLEKASTNHVQRILQHTRDNGPQRRPS